MLVYAIIWFAVCARGELLETSRKYVPKICNRLNINNRAPYNSKIIITIYGIVFNGFINIDVCCRDKIAVNYRVICVSCRCL